MGSRSPNRKRQLWVIFSPLKSTGTLWCIVSSKGIIHSSILQNSADNWWVSVTFSPVKNPPPWWGLQQNYFGQSWSSCNVWIWGLPSSKTIHDIVTPKLLYLNLNQANSKNLEHNYFVYNCLSQQDLFFNSWFTFSQHIHESANFDFRTLLVSRQ